MGAGKQKIDGLFLRSLLRARLPAEKKKIDRKRERNG